MKEKISSLIQDFLKNKGIDPATVRYEIEYPKREEFGDYSTNIAMVLAKTMKKSPQEIASEFIEYSKKDNSFEKIEFLKGFINFYMSPGFVFGEIEKLNAEYFKPNTGEKARVQVEFVSANPTGPLHIGHGRGAAIGDSVARILKFCLYDVEKEYYINDAGMQMKMLGISAFARYKQLHGIETSIPEDGYRGDYLIEIAKKIKERYGDKLLHEEEERAIEICKEIASKEILDSINFTLKRFRVEFDTFFRERELFDSGELEETLKMLKEKGYTYEKDGALWFKSTLFGDDKDRVLKKKDGTYTYFATDIAYHRNKFLIRGFDRVIDVWGSDHHGYVARVAAAIKAMGVNPDRFKVILVQIVNLLKGGNKVSMSTRKGEFVELNTVLDEVGVDAARFMFLSRSTDSHLDFDLDLVKKESSDNPVFYVQYAYARIVNIFKQLGETDVNTHNKPDLEKLKEKEEIDLAKSVLKFKDHLLRACLDLEPHYITRGLLEIAEKLHRFYNRHRVIGSATEKERLFLLTKVANTIELGLNLIGVEAKKRM